MQTQNPSNQSAKRPQKHSRRDRTKPNRWRWWHLSILVLVCCLALITILYAAGNARLQQESSVIQEIRYEHSEAGEVFLVWGIGGWKLPGEELLPEGSRVEDGLAYTPMIREGEFFVARLQLPSWKTVDFLFFITKNQQGDVINIWDSNQQQDYQVVTIGGDNVMEVKSSLSLIQEQASPTAVAGAVVQRIRYLDSVASEVFLVWGIDGWQLPPAELLLEKTVEQDGMMFTPMVQEGEDFAADVQVPSGATIDFIFYITRLQNGEAVHIWDTNGAQKKDYHIAAQAGSVTEIHKVP